MGRCIVSFVKFCGICFVMLCFCGTKKYIFGAFGLLDNETIIRDVNKCVSEDYNFRRECRNNGNCLFTVVKLNCCIYLWKCEVGYLVRAWW